MGIIDRVRDALPFSESEPQADVSASDFSKDSSGSGDDSGPPSSTDSGDGEEDPSIGGESSAEDTDELESGEDEEGTSSESGDSDESESEESHDGEESDSGEKPDGLDRSGVEHYTDSDTMDDHVEEFTERDEESLEEKFDVDLDSIERVDDRTKTRWENLVRRLTEYGDELERRKRERDDRIETKSLRYSPSHEKIKRRAKSSGIIEELRNGFRQMVTRPTPRPAVAGPQMDTNNVVRRASGDRTVQELFEEEVIVETGDRCVGLATDISGSMRSDITELKIAGACIAKATEIIGDDFVWEAFTNKRRYPGEPEKELQLWVVTGPEETFKWRHLDSFDAERDEPTSAAIRDTRMLMEKTSSRQDILIVITDGMALITEDGHKPGSSEPVLQARQAVRECREDGYDVIGFGIGGMSTSKMRQTFGEGNFRLTDIDSLAEDILELYSEQMNVKRGGF